MPNLCDFNNVNDKMQQGIDVANTAEFNCNSYIYLNSIFKRFKSELRKNSNFLEFLECSQISRLFDEFFKKSLKYNNTKNIRLCSIKGGDILIIKCPSIFASYHFIVVAVNIEKTRVSIIQSYGNFKKFHKIDMSFDEFVVLLTTLDSFKIDNKSFDESYLEFIEVEEKLYGVNHIKYIEHLERYRNSLENSVSKSEVNEDSEPEENSYIERAKALDIPPDIYENLEYQYSINQITLEIDVYRVKSEFKTDLCKESVKVGKKKSKGKEKRTLKCKRKIKRESRTKRKKYRKS